MTAVAKVSVAEVRMERAEGPVDECVEVVLEGPDALDKAQEVFRKWSKSAPEPGGGYDKCDFVVTFEDGETYSGRYDLQNTGLNDSGETVRGQMKSFIGFLAGTVRPGWVSDDQWFMICAEKEGNGQAAGAREFLAKYEF